MLRVAISLKLAASKLGGRIAAYWRMIKSLQTGLLLFTGMAGYASARCPATNLHEFLSLSGSLLLAISGSTALNMVLDRDLDARMQRTRSRPLPSGKLSVREAEILGGLLSGAGVVWACLIDPLYGAVVFAGLFLDVVVYTLWLKRRNAWSIIWGGIAGGMPALAGRVLAVGAIDWVGLAMALAVLLWIPTHILTFNLRHARDYARAAIPTFVSAYGERATQILIAASSVLAALAMGLAAYGIGLTWGTLRVLAGFSLGLVGLALWSALRPSPRLNFRLFKAASLYMLGSMTIVLGSAL